MPTSDVLSTVNGSATQLDTETTPPKAKPPMAPPVFSSAPDALAKILSEIANGKTSDARDTPNTETEAFPSTKSEDAQTDAQNARSLDPNSRALNEDDISDLKETVLEKFGAHTALTKFGELFAPDDQAPQWTPETPLTSDKALFVVMFNSATGVVTITNATTGEESTLALAPEGSEAPQSLQISSVARTSSPLPTPGDPSLKTAKEATQKPRKKLAQSR